METQLVVCSTMDEDDLVRKALGTCLPWLLNKDKEKNDHGNAIIVTW
jgi:hypothetical protein